MNSYLFVWMIGFRIVRVPSSLIVLMFVHMNLVTS
jgi:hypothetical protein